ncbi:integrase [Dysgonomonas sp. PFB1-18]|uniref:tyrosine-type recombinase/integrase n=1 Tax=unclassified Dysgonomonas TaxID=2630389 RepID=UPI0024743B13|nr:MULTISPECIES: tyrosine-type recombinase/integrase [unclassified Dysgonomonas]MDH6307389.1 integrase [Dysgonomonas sp. PF1-14]MDH6337307.1 integrase [Dysgonomonas sp. PF1-16]MDH6379231.1 integrase [Dysgonomonas sp. PFB1-18]MDH6396131.1 integrase [Dysgonomonas sp. PF1-23]
MSKKLSNTTADYLEWDSNLLLISKLHQDQNYKLSLLIALGSFWGLRISDLLKLRWCDILNVEFLNLVEKKTQKKRMVKINDQLKKHISVCYTQIQPSSDDSFIFLSQKGSVFSIQRVNVIFKELKKKYKLNIKNFSTHTMRKTFGRAVYNNAGDNSEMALVKLSELFNHSDIKTTRKYLGLRTEELMETYDLLSF